MLPGVETRRPQKKWKNQAVAGERFLGSGTGKLLSWQGGGDWRHHAWDTREAIGIVAPAGSQDRGRRIDHRRIGHGEQRFRRHQGLGRYLSIAYGVDYQLVGRL